MVQFHPPELAERKSSGCDQPSVGAREPVLKTGGGLRRLWVRVPRLPLEQHMVPWSSGNDSWPTPRQRRFDSVRDYLVGAQVHQRQSGTA